ncbi:MAG: hypothetical protein AB8I69_03205 [Anaerolineae bacterium]|jgi:hypothetical protein
MSEYQAAPPTSQGGKPGKVQALAIMTLIDGILNIVIVGFGWGLGILSVVLGTAGIGFPMLLCCPVPIYAIVLGILEIILAAKLLPEPAKVKEFPKYLAVMQIINVISGAILSIVTGILALVFANDPEVVSYFASIPAEPPAESL